MTEQQITELGPAFATYLRRFRGCVGQDRTAGHFDTYCRGLLSDLPRKSVEPIALAAGTGVRTLQEFLVTARWDHAGARDTLPADRAEAPAGCPNDPLGTVGVIDETSRRTWGAHTPGVQRPYLGCVGKVENGIVTVHLGVAEGTFRVRLDADLYLPKVWSDDRPRCRAAGIPDDVRHRPTWRLALDPWVRASGNGVSFDGRVFDAGYGAAVPLRIHEPTAGVRCSGGTGLRPVFPHTGRRPVPPEPHGTASAGSWMRIPGVAGQRLVAAVPVNVAVREKAGGPARRADARPSAADARGGVRHRLTHRTVRASFWRAATARVWVAGREHTPVAATSAATGEVKDVVTSATTAPVARVPAVAFRRWTVEIYQADCTSSRRWVGTGRIGYHRRDGVARAGRVVPAAPGGFHRRSRMPDTTRRPVPPRA